MKTEDLKIDITISTCEPDECNIRFAFPTGLRGRVVSCTIRWFDGNGNGHYILNKKILYIQNEPSTWVYHYNHSISKCLFYIIELHTKGRLLCVRRIDNIHDNSIYETVYLINSDVRFRRENDNTISVFNTNGNLLFLRGIYRVLWNLLCTPHSMEAICVALGNEYSYSSISTALQALCKRNLIISKAKCHIDVI